MHNEDTKYFKNLNTEYLQNLYLQFSRFIFNVDPLNIPVAEHDKNSKHDHYLRNFKFIIIQIRKTLPENFIYNQNLIIVNIVKDISQGER